MGVIAFAGQIFFDFAGYSTCAIGAALCLGFHLKDNFRFPYAAIGFSDFWRRWHISLSTFLRDYLYIPLGGNRVGWTRAAINLVIVMFLGGLWHGAAWTFVVWGLLHGFYLVIEHTLRAFFGNKAWTDSLAVKILLGLVTYAAVCVAWVFFRATDFTVATRLLRGMFGGHATRRRDPLHPRNASDRDRHVLHDSRALVAARDQHRAGGRTSSALGRHRRRGRSWLAPLFSIRETAMPSSTSSFKGFGCRVVLRQAVGDRSARLRAADPGCRGAGSPSSWC